MKKEISENFGKPLERAKLNTYKTFKLSLNDFNTIHDRSFDGQVLDPWAGGERYKMPPQGWYGKALNVG